MAYPAVYFEIPNYTWNLHLIRYGSTESGKRSFAQWILSKACSVRKVAAKKSGHFEVAALTNQSLFLSSN